MSSTPLTALVAIVSEKARLMPGAGGIKVSATNEQISGG